MLCCNCMHEKIVTVNKLLFPVAALPSTEEGPVDCLGSMGACQEVLVLWAVGMKGMCYPDEFGGLIGEGGYVGIWMEVMQSSESKISYVRTCKNYFGIRSSKQLHPRSCTYPFCKVYQTFFIKTLDIGLTIVKACTKIPSCASHE